MEIGQENDQEEKGGSPERQEEGPGPGWRITPKIGEDGEDDRHPSKPCEEEELQSSSTVAVRSA